MEWHGSPVRLHRCFNIQGKKSDSSLLYMCAAFPCHADSLRVFRFTPAVHIYAFRLTGISIVCVSCDL